MTSKPMSLKAFWDAVEEQLGAYTADELRAIVRAFAREASPFERHTFLERLRAAPRETVATLKHAVKPETLLKDIQALANQLKQKMKDAEYYDEYVPTLSLDAAQHARWLEWCLSIANQRVDASVRGQHRGSYNKAAMLIGACAETLHARGEAPQADALVQQVRARYPRHRSFLSELEARCG